MLGEWTILIEHNQILKGWVFRVIKNKRVLALIPARGGSKGLPRKNIRMLGDKPLIAWPIKSALASKYVDQVVVTTDDEEIAGIAKEYGAEVPFLRPSELAADTAPSSAAITHAIRYLELDGIKFDLIILLEPTSPLTDEFDIDKALEKIVISDAKSLVGIGMIEDMHPEFCVLLNNKEFLEPYLRPKFGQVKRRQDLEGLYFFDGSLYISDIDYYKEHQTFYHDLTLGYVFPKRKNLEIDDLIDFLFVESLVKNSELLEGLK